MKNKLIACILVLAFILGLSGCGTNKRGSLKDDEADSFTYIVIDVTESNLLVAEIGQDGKVIEAKLYSVPNWFNPNTEIKEGYKINIKHSGVILETYPIQFAEIISMEYLDKETGLSTIVIPD